MRAERLYKLQNSYFHDFLKAKSKQHCLIEQMMAALSLFLPCSEGSHVHKPSSTIFVFIFFRSWHCLSHDDDDVLLIKQQEVKRTESAPLLGTSTDYSSPQARVERILKSMKGIIINRLSVISRCTAWVGMGDGIIRYEYCRCWSMYSMGRERERVPRRMLGHRIWSAIPASSRVQSTIAAGQARVNNPCNA